MDLSKLISIIRKFATILMVLFFIIWLTLGKGYAEVNDYNWSIFFYGGKWSDNSFLEIIPGNTAIEDSYISTLGISRTIRKLNENILMEGELNVTWHSGLQEHFEFNGALNLRWLTFPWDDYLNTSLAYGLGPSYATKEPEIEENSEGEASRTLLFMMAEITFSPPKHYKSHWELFFRIHHRSGIFGAVNDGGASNFITSGLRYRF